MKGYFMAKNSFVVKVTFKDTIGRLHFSVKLQAEGFNFLKTELLHRYL